MEENTETAAIAEKCTDEASIPPADDEKSQTEQTEWQEKNHKEQSRETQREQEEFKKEYDQKEEIIRQRQLEEKTRFDEEMARQREMQEKINDYIDKGAKTPENMRDFRETNPGKEVCPFFDKTNACRYGDNCSRNHRKIGLSKIILISHFYNHYSLERHACDYDTDMNLEFDSSESRQHFREFYKDIVPELENFGRIKTLKICCNSQFHLRGNVYVEYHSERYAAHAVRNLNGRWYGGRQLTCEPANIPSWRQAICGLKRNCPKGKRTCNFLHTYTNPDDEYAVRSPPKYVKNFYGYTGRTESCSRSERKTKSRWGDTQIPSDSEDQRPNDRNFRWSESPEHNDNWGGWNDNYYRGRCQNRRSQRHDDSRSSSRSSRYSTTPERHKRSSSSRRSRHRYKRNRRYDSHSDEEDYRSTHRKKRRRRSPSKRYHERRRRSRTRKSRRRRRTRSRNRDSSSDRGKYDSEDDKRSLSADEKTREKVENNGKGENPGNEKFEKENGVENGDDTGDSSDDSTEEEENGDANVPVKAIFKPLKEVLKIAHYDWDTTDDETENKKK